MLLYMTSYFCRAGVGKLVLLKGQVVKSVGFADHIISAENTQLYHCSVKAATDIMGPKTHDCVPIKLYLYEQVVAGLTLWA